MAVDLVQVLGIAYLAFMLYLTFLYYQRNQYTLRSFIFWVAVWGCGIVLLLFPQTTSFLTQKLRVARVFDFYMILGIATFSVVSFFSFAKVKQNEQKVEELVRKLALEKKK